MNALTKAGAVLAGAALLAAGTAAPAAAADGLGPARTALTARIDARITALDALSTAVTAARRLTSAHRSTLNGLIAADVSGLTALKTKVAAETTTAALKADATSMVDDYRVYLLVAPAVRLTAAADLAAAAVPVLRTVADKLAAAVAAAKQAGKDTGDADAKLADLRAKLDAGVPGPAVDGLLATRPGPDAQAIKDKVTAARTAVKAARDNLRAALADAKAVRATLKG